MSPRGQRHAPMCCPPNTANGFALATAVHSGTDGTIYGDAWESIIVDAVGITHVFATAHCPACGAPLYGLPHATVPAWSGIAAQEAQNAVDEAVKKVHEAQAALNRVAKERP